MYLYESNLRVNKLAINQKSSDALDYDRYEKENNDGMRVIAIGGDCLSRGLTLECLCVSCFYRNSQTYDTLMQMGRWFGYRDGYRNPFTDFSILIIFFLFFLILLPSI